MINVEKSSLGRYRKRNVLLLFTIIILLLLLGNISTPCLDFHIKMNPLCSKHIFHVKLYITSFYKISIVFSCVCGGGCCACVCVCVYIYSFWEASICEHKQMDGGQWRCKWTYLPSTFIHRPLLDCDPSNLSRPQTHTHASIHTRTHTQTRSSITNHKL